MIKSVFIILTFLISFTIKAQVHVVKFPELKNYLSEKTGDNIKVINFWATWCGPCIKELPYFNSLKDSYSEHKVEVLLVSLDFADQLSKVESFLEKRKISANVWLLDESDANAYIDLVDKRWSGAIPMTLLINSSTGKRIFLEKELTKEELEKHIISLTY